MSEWTKDASDEQEDRRPYEPPAIEETSSFETLALGCDPGHPQYYAGEFS